MCLGIRMVKNDKDREMYMKNSIVSFFNVRWFLYFRMKSMVVLFFIIFVFGYVELDIDFLMLLFYFKVIFIFSVVIFY